MGITEAQAAAVTSLGTKFKNNTSITEFMELGKFGVTSLEPSEFRGCTNLIKADLSKIRILNSSSFENCVNFAGDGNGDLRLPSLTTIGNHAFGGYQNVQCSGLDRVLDLGSIVTLPDGVNSYSGVFRNQINLTEVHLPETLTTIGSRCFGLCSSLTDINLPSSLIRIHDSAFSGCTSLNIVIDTPNLEFLGPNAFCNYGDKIGHLSGIENLGKITDIKNASDNKAGCFRNQKSLTYAKLPNTLTSIGTYAFYGCSALTSVNFPSSLTTIEHSAFDGCSSLEIADLSLPNLGKIGTWAFSHVKITKISNLGKLTSLQNLNWNENIFGDKTTLTSVNLPPTLTSIGNYVFMEYSSLESVTLPPSLTTIGSQVFDGCTSLIIEDLALPNLTSIGNLVFRNATVKKVSNLGKITNLNVPHLTFGKQDTLKEFHIPSSVTSCNSVGTFEGYTNTKFYADWSKITVYNNFAFKNCQALEIQAPDLVNVTIYGDSTFMNCHIIGELSMPNLQNSSLRFNGYNSIAGDLTKVLNLGIKVTTLSSGCFYNNPNLTEVNLPPQLTRIDQEAFRGCSALTKINFPVALTTIGSDAFRDCTSLEIENLALPNLTSIGYNAFSGTRIKKISNLGKLTSFNAENSNTQTFGDRSALTEIIFPETLTSFGDGSIRNYPNLTSVGSGVFPNVTSIGANAFYNIPKVVQPVSFPALTSVVSTSASGNHLTLSKCGFTEFHAPLLDLAKTDVYQTGYGVFSYCPNLRIIDIGKLTVVPFGFAMRCTSLENVSDLSNVTTVYHMAFRETPSLSIHLSLPVCTKILADTANEKDGVFSKSGIRSLDAPMLLEIGKDIYAGGSVGAFQECPNLTLVKLRDVTTIGMKAFYKCIHLTRVVIDNVTPPTLGSNAFAQAYATLTFYVPDSAVDAYKAATG